MKMRNLVIAVSLVLLGLTLAACTRQASTAPVPTTPPAKTAATSVVDPTMETVRLTAVVRASQAVADTQTAVAAGGGVNPTRAATTGAKEVASATPAAMTAATATAAPAVTATPAPAAVACSNPYLVKQGDWIYKIARECKVDPAAIVAANPGVSPNFIIPGQKLNMPTTGKAPQAAICSGTYTVVQGDTLYSIAYRCGLTTEQLATANAIRNPSAIHPGDVLKFP